MWDNDQLEKLIDPRHHRVWFDGYDYWWQIDLTGDWVNHCSKNFGDPDTPYHWIVYNIARWRRILNRNSLLKIKNDAIKLTKLESVINSNKSNRVKITKILTGFPDIDEEDIATLLNIAIRTVRRNIDAYNRHE